MEEEIPLGLYLLRRFSKTQLKSKFPAVSYNKFVLSSIVRISSGYLFLVNALVVLIQAEEVLPIFYDTLALQFIQRLDDIVFAVSKMEVLGIRMQRATMTPYFHTPFQREKGNLGLKWKTRTLLKTLYFINLAVFITCMVVITGRQVSGYYQCKSITALWGNQIWPKAIVMWPQDSLQYPPELVERMVLAYDYFDGVYVKDGSRTMNGRPVYIEMKKSDRTPFDSVAPKMNPYHVDGSQEYAIDPIKPATIKYCEGRWILSHEYIMKSTDETHEGEDCDWLARSPETEGYDLLDVANSKWDVWTGKISQSDVNIQCNYCERESDCNLNGQCIQGKCVCDASKDTVYLGTHCEIVLEENCRRIIGEVHNDIWEVEAVPFSDGVESAWEGEFLEEYSRPVYSYVSGLPTELEPYDKDGMSLLYSGSRYFLINLQGAKEESASEYWMWQTTNYHAFWSRAFSPGVTTLISDSTTNDNPVGVDFNLVGERGSQYGPYGLLSPAMVNNQTGRGLYRCDIEACSFCLNKEILSNVTMPEDFQLFPTASGLSCEFLNIPYAQGLNEGEECNLLKLAGELFSNCSCV